MWPAIIERNKSLKKVDCPTFPSAIKTAMSSNSRRSQVLHNEVFLVAMFLNPRFRKMVTGEFYTLQSVL